MAEVVNMPKLGFDMAEGTLVRWVILEGEPVTKGAVLAEIETDKATVEVEAAVEGVMARHLVDEGAVVPVNTPIAVVGAPGEKVDLSAISAAPPPAEEKPAEAIKVEPQPPAPAAPAVVEPESPLEAAGHLPEGVRASPLARRMAAERGIDLSLVAGSGPGGRITRKDIETYKAAVPVPAAPLAAPTPARPAAPSIPPLAPLPSAAPVASQTIPLNRLRALIGKRMVDAKQQAPHFYVTHEYDVAALLDLRMNTNKLLPDDQQISVNDFIVKAVALCLRGYPNLNASLRGDQVVHHGQINIGVAVAVEGGLLTVVNKDTDRKPLRQIAVELRAMVARARSGKVRPDDIEGSTFSVSNMGMYNVENFIAIINPPEAAILAVGSASQVPVVSDGAVVPGWRMKATISVDHRVSDGAEAARFLRSLEACIQEPLRLLV